MTRSSWQTRALMLFFKLNADMLLYTPMSHRARRASRVMPRLLDAMERRKPSLLQKQAG